MGQFRKINSLLIRREWPPGGKIAHDFKTVGIHAFRTHRIRTGTVTANIKKKRYEFATKREVKKAPEIIKAPASMGTTETIVVRGRNLQLATKWYVGKIEVELLAKSKKKVKLRATSIPLGNTRILAFMDEMTFKSPEKLAVVPVLQIEALAYTPSGKFFKGHKGFVIGSGFSDETKLKMGGKKTTSEEPRKVAHRHSQCHGATAHAPRKHLRGNERRRRNHRKKTRNRAHISRR